MKQVVLVHAIINKHQKVLLLRRSSDETYQLSGGVVAFGEKPGIAIKRWVKKQLGRNASVIQVFDVISEIDNDTQLLDIIFLMSFEGGNSRLDITSPFDHYEWVIVSETQQFRTENLTKKALQIYQDQYGKTISYQINDASSTTLDSKKEVVVYTDGGSRGNPGPSAAGFVILNDNNELLFEGGKYLGITTNNQAEYQAVKLGLEKAYELGADVVKFRMDSLLIVNQMLGIYQIKNRDLWPIYASIKETIKKFKKVTFSHVRREFNKEADALVNKVLDEHQ